MCPKALLHTAMSRTHAMGGSTQPRHHSGTKHSISECARNTLSTIANLQDIVIGDVGVSAQQLSALVKLIDGNVLSGRMAKDVFALMVDGDKRLPGDIAEAHGMVQITDNSEL